MKKLMTLMLALSFMTATVAVSFAQGDTTATKKKKKSSKKKDETVEKKGGSR